MGEISEIKKLAVKLATSKSPCMSKRNPCHVYNQKFLFCITLSSCRCERASLYISELITVCPTRIDSDVPSLMLNKKEKVASPTKSLRQSKKIIGSWYEYATNYTRLLIHQLLWIVFDSE